MLAPHELKNKTFSKSIKGYSATEVDDYIEFLIDKYTEAYRENNELERKLKIVANNLEEIKDEEESIRTTLISAQKMSEKIIRDAKEKADIITSAIKERCDTIIAQFKEELVKEKEEMWKIRTSILDFKRDVFELYRKQIEELQELSVNDIEEIVLPNEDIIVNKIFNEVKGTIESQLDKSPQEEELEEQPILPINSEKNFVAHFDNENGTNEEDDGDDTEIEDSFLKMLQEEEE